MIRPFQVMSKIFRDNSKTINAGTTETEVFSERNAGNLATRVTHIGTDINLAGGWGSIILHFKINGVRIFPYDNQYDQLNLLVDLGEHIIIPPGGVFSCTADNIGGVPYNVSIKYKADLGR